MSNQCLTCEMCFDVGSTCGECELKHVVVSPDDALTILIVIGDAIDTNITRMRNGEPPVFDEAGIANLRAIAERLRKQLAESES